MFLQEKAFHIDRNGENHPYSIMPGNLKLIPIPCRCVELKDRRATGYRGSRKIKNPSGHVILGIIIHTTT